MWGSGVSGDCARSGRVALQGWPPAGCGTQVTPTIMSQVTPYPRAPDVARGKRGILNRVWVRGNIFIIISADGMQANFEFEKGEEIETR